MRAKSMTSKAPAERVLKDIRRATRVNFVDCTVLVAAVSLIVAMPISVAGWGVREGALIVVLGTIGVPAGDAVASSLLAGVASLIVALPGGLLLLVFK